MRSRTSNRPIAAGVVMGRGNSAHYDPARLDTAESVTDSGCSVTRIVESESMISRQRAAGVAALAMVLSWAAMPLAGQAPARGPVASKSAFTAPKTPWGDPDLQGIFTNNDENGIPFKRPDEFAGKTLSDVTPEQL